MKEPPIPAKRSTKVNLDFGIEVILVINSEKNSVKFCQKSPKLLTRNLSISDFKKT